MGHRANFFIVQNGEHRVFYDHWAAMRIEAELFWGPEFTLKFIESVAHDDGPVPICDEVLGEGGAVVDLDHKLLLWFSSNLYNIFERRQMMALMRFQWKGWTDRWAARGMLDLLDYVGLPAEPWQDPQSAEYRLMRRADDHPWDCLLLTVHRDGETRAGKAAGSLRALQHGPERVQTLLDSPFNQSFVWTGESPEGGIHLDLDARRLFYWDTEQDSARESLVQAAWPGWRVHDLGDRYEEHVALARILIRFLEHDGVSHVDAILDNVLRNAEHDGRNPMRDLAEALGATHFNPLADVTRASAGDLETKRRIVDELRRRHGSDRR